MPVPVKMQQMHKKMQQIYQNETKLWAVSHCCQNLFRKGLEDQGKKIQVRTSVKATKLSQLLR